MGLGNVKPSEKNGPSYEVSGKPWAIGALDAAGTAVEVTFPTVTRWIQITNNSANPVRVGFSKNGVDATETANYFVVEGKSTSTVHTTPRLELRCKSIFLKKHSTGTATVSIVAGLTDIPDMNLPLTGSGGIG